MNNMNVDYVTLHYRSVLNDFSNQFLNEEFSDCVLNAEGKSLKVHRAMLCAQSSFLEKIILEHQNVGELCFIIEGVSFEHLNLVVQFMYTGSTKLNKNNFGPFLVVAELLGVKWLDRIQILSDTESSATVISNVADVIEPTEPKTVRECSETQSVSAHSNVTSSVFKNITNVLDSKLVKRKKHMKGKKHCKRSKCGKEDRNERKKHKSMHSFRHDHSSKSHQKVPGKETHLADMDESTFCTALGLKKNVEVQPRELNSKPESVDVKTDQKVLAKSKSVPPLIKINRDLKSNAENFESRDSSLLVSEINTVYIEDKNLSFLNIDANELCIRENNIEIECDVLDASSSQFVIEKEAAGDVVEIREENLIQAEFVDINPESTGKQNDTYLQPPPVLVLQVKDVNESNLVIWYPTKKTASDEPVEKNSSAEPRVCEQTKITVEVPNLNINPDDIIEEESLLNSVANRLTSGNVTESGTTPPSEVSEALPSSGVEKETTRGTDEVVGEKIAATVDDVETPVPQVDEEEPIPSSIPEQTHSPQVDEEEPTPSSVIEQTRSDVSDIVDKETTAGTIDAETDTSVVTQQPATSVVDDASNAETTARFVNDDTALLRMVDCEDAPTSVVTQQPATPVVDDASNAKTTACSVNDEPSTPADVDDDMAPLEIVDCEDAPQGVTDDGPSTSNVLDSEPSSSSAHYGESSHTMQPPHVESIASADKEVEADCGVQPLPDDEEPTKTSPVVVRSQERNDSSKRVSSPVNVVRNIRPVQTYLNQKQSLEMRHKRIICATKGSVVYGPFLAKTVNLRKSPRFEPKKTTKRIGSQTSSNKSRKDSHQENLEKTFNLKPFVIKLNKFRNEKERNDAEKMSFLSNFNLKKRGVSPIIREHSYGLNFSRSECLRPRMKRKHTAATVAVKRKSQRSIPANLCNLKSVTVELEKLDDIELRQRIHREHSYDANL